MTLRLSLILGLFTAVLVGEPATVLGKDSSGPTLDGWQAPKKVVATDAAAPGGVQVDSPTIPAIRFLDPNKPQAEHAADDKAAADESIQPASELKAASTAEPPRDPLIELTSRMVDDSDVVRAQNEEIMPADLQSYDQPYCCPPQRPLFWVGGVEATFLWPDVNNSSSTFEYEDEFLNQEVSYSSACDDTDSMFLTPRIWLGVQGCAWGTNVRYWHLRAGGGSYDPVLDESNGWEHSDWDWDALPDTGFFSDSQLDAYTIDWEVTRRFCVHDCAMQASLGVRHGSVALQDSITGAALSDDARYMGYARSNAYSRGTGISMGLYGRKPLFPCSCVHWFYNARWSALWGPTSTSAETFAAVMTDGGSAGSVNGASTYVDDTLFIGEFQLGLEWNYALQCLPANAFFRTAVEYQRWDGGAGSSEAGSFATFTDNTFTSIANTATSAASPQLDLLGITIGTGLTW